VTPSARPLRRSRHFGNSSPVISRTIYSAYQSGQFEPVGFSDHHAVWMELQGPLLGETARRAGFSGGSREPSSRWMVGRPPPSTGRGLSKPFCSSKKPFAGWASRSISGLLTPCDHAASPTLRVYDAGPGIRVCAEPDERRGGHRFETVTLFFASGRSSSPPTQFQRFFEIPSRRSSLPAIGGSRKPDVV
jgi:hypothetical protein